MATRLALRYKFIFIATLLICFVSSAPSAHAQTVGAGDVLISEFRLSGPGGESDEYIELYCNRDTACDISDYALQAFDPNFGDFADSFPEGTVLAPRGNLLVGDGSQYTLFSYGALDFDVSAGFDYYVDNEGLQLLSPDGNVVIDSVGFTGSTGGNGYIEGTGLQPATGARPADQYAYVRKTGTANGGRPQDTNNNANDFVLVSVTGAAQPGITQPPVLGAPGPQSSSSPSDFTATVPISLVEPNASQSSSPNRVRAGSGDAGTISIRRSFTNNTDDTLAYLSFRVIDMTTLNSPNVFGGAQQADLRLVTSGDAETFTNSQGRAVVIRGTVLEFDDGETEPNQPNGGGLNSTVHVDVPGGLAVGETVDVQFLLTVVKSGLFRFYVNFEGFNGAVARPSAASGRPTGATPTTRRAPARRLVSIKRRGEAGTFKSGEKFMLKPTVRKTSPVVTRATPAVNKTTSAVNKATPVVTKATPAATKATSVKMRQQ
ncbi:MAG: lamin tail domain-containing protein [Pyrinomonadaceae bacterium]